MNIQSFMFDPIQKRAMVIFQEPISNSSGNLSIAVSMEKHETIEQVEKHARHKVAEMLEAAAKTLREHHG